MCIYIIYNILYIIYNILYILYIIYYIYYILYILYIIYIIYYIYYIYTIYILYIYIIYIYIIYILYIYIFIIFSLFSIIPERNMTILRYNSHFQTRSLPEQDIIKEEHGYIYIYRQRTEMGERWGYNRHQFLCHDFRFLKVATRGCAN